MKAVQSTLFVSILTLLLGVSVPAQAAPSLQPDTLSDRDLELLFEQDGKPMQLALLSDQEMAETEGAWIPWVIFGSRVVGFGAAGALLYADRYGGFYGAGSMGYGHGFWDFVIAHAILGMISTNPALVALVGMPYSALVQQHGSVGNLMRYVRESASGRSL